MNSGSLIFILIKKSFIFYNSSFYWEIVTRMAGVWSLIWIKRKNTTIWQLKMVMMPEEFGAMMP